MGYDNRTNNVAGHQEIHSDERGLGKVVAESIGNDITIFSRQGYGGATRGADDSENDDNDPDGLDGVACRTDNQLEYIHAQEPNAR